MKIKVKGPIVIELTDLEFDTDEIKESIKFVPMMFTSVLQQRSDPRTPPQILKAVPLKLSKEELLAFATQMKIESLDQMIKDLVEISKRRKEEKTSA